MEQISPRFKLPPASIRWHDDSQDFYFAGQLEDYRIMGKLGQGQYGIVKLGVHVGTNERVAMKIINKADLSDIERESLKREAEVMSYLNHRNIIRTIAVIENRINLCLIMEFAAGGELFDHIIRQSKLKEVEARNYFVQMLEGIGYCHSKRIIHRDIKAENIFLDEKLEAVKIGDFGFSSIMGDDQEEENCGSLDYAAPEILGARTRPGPEGDVWALGVVLYFMVTGTLPFKAATDFDVYQKIRKADFRPLPTSTVPELVSVLQLIFNTNPLNRPTIATLLKQPWCLQAQKDPEYLKHPKMSRMLQLQIKQNFQVRVKRMSQSEKVAHGESAISPRSMLPSSSDPNLMSKVMSSSHGPHLSSAPTHASQPALSLSSKVAAAKLARQRSSQKAAGTPIIHEDKSLSPPKRLSAKTPVGSSKSAERVGSSDRTKRKSRSHEHKTDSDKTKTDTEKSGEDASPSTEDKSAEGKEKEATEPSEKGKSKDKDKSADKSKKKSDKPLHHVKKRHRKHEILEEDEEGIAAVEPEESPRVPAEPIPAAPSIRVSAVPPLIIALPIPLPPGGNKAPQRLPDESISRQPPAIHARDLADEAVVRALNRRPSYAPLPIALPVPRSRSPSSPHSTRKPLSPNARDSRDGTPISPSAPSVVAIASQEASLSRSTSPKTSPGPSPRRGKGSLSRKSSLMNVGRVQRNSMRMSDFSVVKVSQDQLDKLKENKDVEILSVEREGESNVVVISAPASRRRMNTVRDLLLQFEKNATKLKRSKSTEFLAVTPSLFGHPANWTPRGVDQKLVTPIKRGTFPPKDSDSPVALRISPAERPEIRSAKKLAVKKTRSNSYNHEMFRELLQKKKEELPDPGGFRRSHTGQRFDLSHVISPSKDKDSARHAEAPNEKDRDIESKDKTDPQNQQT